MTVLLSIITFLSILFMNLTHPLAMGLTIVIHSIIISLLLGMLNHSFWYSYILFMIFLGGMLILFIYTATIASNEMFSFNINKSSIIMFSLIFFFSLTMCKDTIIFFSTLITSPISSSDPTLLNSTLNHVINWMYNNPTYIMTLFIILYLLLALIIMVKIMNLMKGPLRLTNN